jgi:hypothetical protein
MIDNLMSSGRSITPPKRINRKMLNQYAYVPVETPVNDNKNENNRSKSKSISKIKQDKASVLFNPRPRIYEPPAPFSNTQPMRNSER